MGRRYTLPVYQFDLEGKLIYKHASIEIASENLMLPKKTIQHYINTGRCCKKTWYFARTPNIDIQVKRHSHNPLITNNKYYMEKFLDIDVELEDED
jgi:hypothetical protein